MEREERRGRLNWPSSSYGIRLQQESSEAEEVNIQTSGCKPCRGGVAGDPTRKSRGCSPFLAGDVEQGVVTWLILQGS